MDLITADLYTVGFDDGFSRIALSVEDEDVSARDWRREVAGVVVEGVALVVEYVIKLDVGGRALVLVLCGFGVEADLWGV